MSRSVPQKRGTKSDTLRPATSLSLRAEQDHFPEIFADLDRSQPSDQQHGRNRSPECLDELSFATMFEQWPDEFTPSLRHEVHPPRPVTVDLSIAIPTHSPTFGANELPLRVRSGGLDLTQTVAGHLHAWARSRDGDWIGLISCTLETSNQRGRLNITQWCSQRAITPRSEGTP